MAFNLPVQNFFTPTEGPDSWTRPNDWPIINDVPNVVQFLMSDLGSANCIISTEFTRISGSQDIIIDWGDGATDIITTPSATSTSHQYTVGTGTPCSLGYTTFVVSIYFIGSGTSILTSCKIQAIYSLTTNTYSSQTCGLLEAYYGDNTVTQVAPNFNSTLGGSNSVSQFVNLVYVKLPATVTWSTEFPRFTNCTALTTVVLPRSAPNMTSSPNFSGCYSLLKVTLASDSVNITTLASVFQNCRNLKSVTLPSTLNSCASMANAFTGCAALKTFTFPPLNNCTNYSSTFNGCNQLQWVDFRNMPTIATVISFSNTFSSCYELQNVYFPDTVNTLSTYTFTSTFSSCYNLRSIIFPKNLKSNGYASTFSNCYRLSSCIMPSVSQGGVTGIQTMFASCFNLTKVTLSPSFGGSVNASGLFQNCFKLETVTLPNLPFTTLATAFSNCFSLKTINWSPGSLPSLSSLQSVFANCYLLESVSLPTNMPNVTNISSLFQNCYSLKTVRFPSTMSLISAASQLFSGCTNLQSVILPTNMQACTNFSNMFEKCSLIETILMPATVSANTTTFASAFADCYSLKTVTLPSINQLFLVNSISTMFYGCFSLTAIINFNKIGSLTATPLINATNLLFNKFHSISFVGPLSALALSGASDTNGRSDVREVRLLNTSAGQWTGASPQINVSFTNMSTANLIQLFNDMAAQGTVTSKTINITGATGTSGLTATDRQIITTRGWTITG